MASMLGSASLVAACGKFQPFHNEHLEYLLAAVNEGQRCVIGITNPDPSYIRHERLDPVRGLPESNPATYYERLLMVTNSLCDAGVSRNRFEVVPFPINVPESWLNYFPRDALVLLTLYDDDPWLPERKARLENNGLVTKVLWRRVRKGISGADIRWRIAAGQPWKHLVPAATAKIISLCGIDERIRAEGTERPDGSRL
ncbi:hypothetical protein [Lentzea sp. HUAS12]|uniref:hypothetical protein n=1 Tax=Lentzea sp. HUAS12 TaxID=2951806 RepID=UPI0020A1A807|nr:hypothetical protein [Lentzea sp. HUAS12]USX56224.1 hypothetical protein ND450_19620 [Lentzea sp. HUAS12]